MVTRLQRYVNRDNVVFMLSVFIIFILLFEERLVIPVALQAFGRLHPLVLHVPIVLLLVAFGLEAFGRGLGAERQNRSGTA